MKLLFRQIYFHQYHLFSILPTRNIRCHKIKYCSNKLIIIILVAQDLLQNSPIKSVFFSVDVTFFLSMATREEKNREIKQMQQLRRTGKYVPNKRRFSPFFLLLIRSVRSRHGLPHLAFPHVPFPCARDTSRHATPRHGARAAAASARRPRTHTLVAPPPSSRAGADASRRRGRRGGAGDGDAPM